MFKLLTSLLMLIVAGAVFVGYTHPTYAKVQDLQQQSAQLDQILNEANEFQQLKGELMTRYNALPADMLARLTKLLPDHVDNVRLILDIDSLAASDDLSLQNVVIDSPDASGPGSAGTTATSDASGAASTGALGAISQQQQPYGSLTLDFKTVGTYEDFTRFLSQLQSSLRLVDVVGLSMQASSVTAGGKTAAAPVYSYTVKLQTYWLK